MITFTKYFISIPLLFCCCSLALASDCTVIQHLPYTISAPGEYCLNEDIVLPQSADCANSSCVGINIQSSDVTVDFKGHFIINNIFNIKTTGVLAASNDPNIYKNISVKNGIVSGFYNGIILQAWNETINWPTQNQTAYLIENMVINIFNTRGIDLVGVKNIARNNTIVNTAFAKQTEGIRNYGGLNKILNNYIRLEYPNYGIGITNCGGDKVYIEGNIIEGPSPTSSIYGSYGFVNCRMDAGVPTSSYLKDNSFSNLSYGIYVYPDTKAVYTKNSTDNVTTPYTGGTNGGGNTANKQL